MNQDHQHSSEKKINFYISYIKGIALIGIILIHLIDWSNMPVSFGGLLLKELFHVGVFLFVLTAGSVVFIAYKNKTPRQAFERLWYRGVQLLFFYYAYNIIKMLVFDFSTEPFYTQFINDGKFTISNIVSFNSFSTPITILLLYVFLLVLSPLFLYIHKKSHYPKISIALLIVGIFLINYITVIPFIVSPVTNFLYANGNVLFPLALWVIPFLIGFFLAQTGFEKQRKNILIASGIITAVFGVSLFFEQKSLFPSNYQFPLDPYYMAFGLFILSLFLYVFRFLEKQKTVWIKKTLTAIRFFGDNTLHLYLYHWIVIDCTIWLFPSYEWLIWVTSPLFFVLYIAIRKQKVLEYYSHQESAIQNMALEIE